MKCFIAAEYGSPDFLALCAIDKPIVKPGDVLVRLRAASLNASDLGDL